MPPSPRRTLGIYIHFPWCLSKCPYCDFVVRAAPRGAIDHDGYADAVLRELEQRSRAMASGAHTLATIFVGGGTPSLWSPPALARVLGAVAARFGKRLDELEVSLEADPSSLDDPTAAALVASGVNRLSIGVQSLSEERLRFLGRIHTPDDGRAALRAAMSAGTPRVSADMMYAVPGQPPDEAAREAGELADLGATHVSAYSLTVEPATPFGSLARRGKLPLYDDGEMTEAFYAVDEALAARGFRHYEVSNHARPAEESAHNVGYWTGRDYLGLGCGAYGTLGTVDGEAARYRNDTSPTRYVDTMRAGRDPTTFVENLDGETRMRERIMLGLRMQEGVDLGEVARELDVDPLAGGRAEALERLEARGRIARSGLRVSVPRAAWIWVDQTAAALF